MSFIQGLHGVAALALLSGLLFAEEAGVPLPFAPGEIVLAAAGLLIAAGGLNPLLFLPLAITACVAGSLVGYGWARLVGPTGLAAVAKKVHQQKALDRVEKRVGSSGPVGIGITRLIPGLRIYTTLVAGALRVPRRTFIVGMVPATVAWVVVFVVLGAIVGIPVERFFNQLERIAVQGVILLVVAGGGYLAIRRIPASSGSGLVQVRRSVRVAVAVAVDIAVVVSLVSGLLAVVRLLLGLTLMDGWLEAGLALLLVAIFYVVIAKRGTGATVGEALLQTPYVTGRQIPLRPRAAWAAVWSNRDTAAEDLGTAAAMFRALGQTAQLRLFVTLAEQPRTLDELAEETGLPSMEVLHGANRLIESGLIERSGADPLLTHQVRADLKGPLAELLHHASAVTASSK